MRKYGLVKGEYAAMLLAQGGRCAICGNKPRKFRLAVDHDHYNGAVRGLLCLRCNQILGLFEFDKGKVDRLLAYLRPIAEAWELRPIDSSVIMDQSSKRTKRRRSPVPTKTRR